MAINNKGMVIEIIAFSVIGIIVVLLFGGLIYGFNLFSSKLTDSSSLDINGVNITGATIPTIGNLNTGLGNLRLIASIIIIGYFLSTLIFAYFSSKHPIWLVVYIFIAIILTIFSVYISNSYTNLKSNPTVASMVSGFSISDIIISQLPIFVALLSLLGITLSIVGIVAARRVFE